MPLVYPSHEIKPTAIRSCKTTYVNASGRAEGSGKTATEAVKNALAAARDEIVAAVADVDALICPQVGCDGFCEKRGKRRVGKGIDRNVPVKKADGTWLARAWGFESFEVLCRCNQS